MISRCKDLQTAVAAADDAVFLSNLEEGPAETTNLRRRHWEIVDSVTTKLEMLSQGLGRD